VAIDDRAEPAPESDAVTSSDARRATLPPEDLGGEAACWAHLVDELDGTEGW